MSESAQETVFCSEEDSSQMQSQPPPPHYEHYMAKEEELASGDYTDMPPSYDMVVFNSASLSINRRARRRLGYNWGQIGTKQKLKSIVYALLFIGVFVFLPTLFIVVGLMYKKECPIESALPLWLVIEGIFLITLGISTILPTKFSRGAQQQDEQLLDFPLITSICMLLFFMWLLRGSVLVFGIDERVTNEMTSTSDLIDSANYCHYVCFSFVLWTVRCSWYLLGSLVLFTFTFISYQIYKVKTQLQQQCTQC